MCFVVDEDLMMRTIKFRGWDKYSKKWTLEDLMIGVLILTEHWSEWTGLTPKGLRYMRGILLWRKIWAAWGW
jgi:hypothetical protein